jgi:hypothetical protein
LFEQLERSKKQYKSRKVKGVGELAQAIRAIIDKLTKYYTATNRKQGLFYRLVTILNPLQKIEIF